jgi:hypothetical protein
MGITYTGTEGLSLQAGAGNSHRDLQAQEHNSLHQAAYEAGYARGREAGYLIGYKEGLAAGLKSAAVDPATLEASEAASPTIKHSGPRLLGRPCVQCGAFFYSEDASCPRCKTPRATPKPE